MPRCAILVLSCGLDVYQEFKRVQLATWVNYARHEGLDVYFCEGRGVQTDPNYFQTSDFNLVEGQTISVDCSDGLNASFLKTLVALRFLFDEQGYDCVFRTNLSSFLNVRSFARYVASIEYPSDFYAGVQGRTSVLPEHFYVNGQKIMCRLARFGDFFSPQVDFASGAGMFIGSNIYRKIRERRKLRNFIDDVALGYNLDIRRSEIVPLLRFSLSLESYRAGILDGAEHRTFLAGGGFHYRCKNKYRKSDVDLISCLGEAFA
jgi:hypothetical protein